MKLLIFGIDGMSMNFITSHLDNLPFFKKVISEGCYGTMKSLSLTDDGKPKMSSSMDIWTSLYCGLSPKEHKLGGTLMRNLPKVKLILHISNLATNYSFLVRTIFPIHYLLFVQKKV